MLYRVNAEQISGSPTYLSSHRFLLRLRSGRGLVQTVSPALRFLAQSVVSTADQCRKLFTCMQPCFLQVLLVHILKWNVLLVSALHRTDGDWLDACCLLTETNGKHRKLRSAVWGDVTLFVRPSDWRIPVHQLCWPASALADLTCMLAQCR